MGVCLADSGVAGCLAADRVDDDVIRSTKQVKTVFIAKSYIFFNASTIVLSAAIIRQKRARKTLFFVNFPNT